MTATDINIGIEAGDRQKIATGLSKTRALLGDALRSWCNPAGEDRRSGVFSPELFAGALRGYLAATSGWIKPAEQAAILPATLTIIVELAARFCADALNESYFGWDSERYASRSEHNQVRAAGQLALARSCAEQYSALEERAATLFGQAVPSGDC